MPVSLACITSRNSCARFCRPKVAFNTLVAVGLGYYALALVGGHYREINNEINRQQIQNETADFPNEPKRILYWTGFYGNKNMNFGFGQAPFIQAGCPVTNCWATANRSDFNQSDVIMFHINVDYNDKDLPEHRFQNQRYIFYHMESFPVGSDGKSQSPGLNVTSHFFNWTMTHRRDSDVYIAWPYGAMKRKVGSSVLNWLPPPLPKNSKPPLPSQMMKISSTKSSSFSNRTKMIAWFCSHTTTHGQREYYVQELSKHIPVDVYGRCGNLTCKPNMGTPCDSLLDNYKFYLAAENSLCPDYVTEKFYRALKNGVIPIVYGGADYTQYAPPHSYIHVADFGSPKQLAEYLHFLAGNEAMYNKYFDWKEDWEVVNNPYNGLCDLCAKLNDPDSSTEIKTYENISKWWYDDVPCYPGTSFLNSLSKTT